MATTGFFHQTKGPTDNKVPQATYLIMFKPDKDFNKKCNENKIGIMVRTSTCSYFDNKGHYELSEIEKISMFFDMTKIRNDEWEMND